MISFVLASSCSRAKAVADSFPITTENASSEGILFLTISVQNLPDYEYPAFDIIQKQLVPGVLKSRSFQEMPAGEGGYIVSLLNADMEEVASQKVADPLVLHAELSSEDGSLNRQEVQLSYAEIPLRFQLKSDVHFLNICKFLRDGTCLTIAKLSLSPSDYEAP
jgi:hypothetical protein